MVPYVRKIHSMLPGQYTYPTGATKVLDHLYLSGHMEARDFNLLRQLGVTHVLNCAANDIDTNLAYYSGKSNVRQFCGFKAEDDHDYAIMQHFEEAFAVIEDARNSNGVALIHCQMGINRSGALTVAYIMAHRKCGPVTAVKEVLAKRKYLLSNEEFQKQLVEFARTRDLLELDKDCV